MLFCTCCSGPGSPTGSRALPLCLSGSLALSLSHRSHSHSRRSRLSRLYPANETPTHAHTDVLRWCCCRAAFAHVCVRPCVGVGSCVCVRRRAVVASLFYIERPMAAPVSCWAVSVQVQHVRARTRSLSPEKFFEFFPTHLSFSLLIFSGAQIVRVQLFLAAYSSSALTHTHALSLARTHSLSGGGCWCMCAC